MWRSRRRCLQRPKKSILTPNWSIAVSRAVEFAKFSDIGRFSRPRIVSLVQVIVVPVEAMLATQAVEAEVETKKLYLTPTTTSQQVPSRDSGDWTIVDIEKSNASARAKSLLLQMLTEKALLNPGKLLQCFFFHLFLNLRFIYNLLCRLLFSL